MKTKHIILFLAILIYGCSGNTPPVEKESTGSGNDLMKEAEKKPDPEHEKKGIGKFTHIDIPATLDAKMAEGGNKTYDLKCSSCHKLTGEKLVGPGWKGVTARRDAAWVMNFVTNTDEMLNKDPKAMAMLEECLVRMPNQNLSDEDARAVYEFMRKNDGVK